MAGEDVPFPDAILSLASKPVILPDSKVSHTENTCGDGWDVTEKNITEDMIPPALSKVGQNMLDRQLNDLVEQLPKVENVDIANYERGQEPIAEVNDVIVIKVIHYIVPLKFTIVIISVHFFSHRLVQSVIEVTKEVPSLFRSKIKHKDKTAHVNQGACYN